MFAVPYKKMINKGKDNKETKMAATKKSAKASSSASSSSSSSALLGLRYEVMLGCQKLSFDAFVEAWDKEQTQLHEDKFTHIQLKVRWANLPTNAPKNKLQTMP